MTSQGTRTVDSCARTSSTEIAARELGRLSPADALALVLLINERAPHRSERAAARWIAIFVDAAGQMTLADLELTVVSLGANAGSRSAANVLSSVSDAYGIPMVGSALARARLG